jgi:hypothetical protein
MEQNQQNFKPAREIKFRAWDKRTNSWYRNGDGFALSWDATEIFDDNDKLEQVKNNIVFQQYTGRKDKHLREIYEGDVIKKCYGASIPTFIVAWDNQRAMYIQHDGYNEPLHNIAPELIEVVGNIFETPSLIPSALAV